MSEQTLIQNTPTPQTRAKLAEDLRRLGLTAGMTVLVHSSLKSLGWVSGGQTAAVQALMDVLTSEGTLVMPTHSGDLSNPALWQRPPVPESWHEEIRQTMPGFHPAYTPTRGMGKIVDAFRTFPGVVRSNHPAYSFAAWGKHKERIIENHSLDYGLGTKSPLQKIYDLDGYVLLLGVSYDSNTSFHLAEHIVDHQVHITSGAPILVDSENKWTTYKNLEFNDDVFLDIGKSLEDAQMVTLKNVGLADCKFFRQKPAVDFAVKWLDEYYKQKLK